MGSRLRVEHSGKSLDSYSVLEKNSGTPPLLVSASPTHASTDPPDGGAVAWLQVAASFFVFMDTWYDRHIELDEFGLISADLGASLTPLVHIRTFMKSTSSAPVHPPPFRGLAQFRPSSYYSSAH